MTCNIPTMLTWLRILLIPVFVGVFYLPTDPQAFGAIPAHWVNVTATLIFAVAAFTDWLDGYLARRLNQTSAFGAFLDPVADKLMVAAALIVLVEFERVGAMIALIIIGREIAISALREWMAGEGQSGSVGVAMIGKIKTAVQMVAILFLLYWDKVGAFPTKTVGQILIAIAAFLTLLSMAYYLQAALPKLKRK
ncbi:MAG: CDP-diacylglycerol--glycerol-3-phosphate 3-phosphatidyltransferase [Methylotenera sp.]|jgi:CDP-diacylglycerol--glycerol-3-phosphate 3-phosphatidyltransferase/cardiolipin synthase|uniref:CDP-diacylglycerol--glycerol-3-phosphate 3-phosphatidyltransferase n=1 Tax=Methylotenera sp. TaxID=2051956 RepID=UPI00271B6B92|nr:CDP-diacylglycerol--glycerol-3-phosphate 3-phosphatidyltransferase [Methylotenera sp.]MDO9050930.1 CDP-diacylglycerol--glycerol-3-phosphate 3-phosphatidyltransferase [Methylotenera sp.]MDO9233707.1 CDP-diacylglycerol--glycerol-3-phosphate 3-phosphatidyltransferase [Methylotenera sp.]MDO9390065.1 CDP-diacylglycerol--glycerol-3-phosphate 3-phosphatidyltransferase [Methylotenera sp.]MDP1596387.1 CDP-diacylglycerol--glycerol-3-phosphate 3-phosphatidyltransferase [Methylotenera sp.]MDP1754967.1 